MFVFLAIKYEEATSKIAECMAIKELEAYNVSKFAGLASIGISSFNDFIKQGIIFFLLYLYINGKVSLGDLLFVQMLLGIYTASLSELIGFNITLTSLFSSLTFGENEIIGKEEQNIGKEKLKDIENIAVELNGYSFRNSSSVLLNNINFKANAGDVIGIMGDSGCGKSTLVKIIARLYESKNSVFINGKSIENYSRESFYKNVYYLPQTPVLFPGTVADNITIFNEDADSLKISEFCQELGFFDDIISFNNGIEKDIGENGSNFSGGQRQKIAIARALISNPSIVMGVHIQVFQRTALVIMDMVKVPLNKCILLFCLRV